MSELTASEFEPDWTERRLNIQEKLETGELKLVFIIGVARSGTTWLSELLGEYQSCTSIGETHLFNAYLGKIPTGIHNLRNASVGISRLCTEKEFITAVRRFVLQLFFKNANFSKLPQIVIEKTPPNSHFIPFIYSVLPDAYYLHIVRDPRAVAASQNAASETWASDWASTGSIAKALHWIDVNQKCEWLKDKTNRFYQVRYEDLRQAPALELRKIHDWLGTNAQFDDCELAVSNCTIDLLRARMAKKVSNPTEFFRHGRTEGWRDELTSRQVTRIEYFARQSMEMYGYDTVTTRLRFLPSALAFRIVNFLDANCREVLLKARNRL